MSHKGVVRRFFGDAGMVAVRIERSDGVFVSLPVARNVADTLVATFGVPRPDGVDMSGVIGLAVIYEESEVGMVVRLEVAPHSSTAPP